MFSTNVKETEIRIYFGQAKKVDFACVQSHTLDKRSATGFGMHEHIIHEALKFARATQATIFVM